MKKIVITMLVLLSAAYAVGIGCLLYTSVMFNCEMIPAENVGVKHAKWDKRDGYKVGRDCYNSYFYIVEDLVGCRITEVIQTVNHTVFTYQSQQCHGQTRRKRCV